MPDTRYKVYFGERSASLEELNRIEEIVIEQEMDAIWEARLRFFMCLDDQGRWRHLAGEFAQPFSRVRIELQTGGRLFVPLIEGPVATYESSLASQPGRSTITVVVRDDSAFLNRQDLNVRYDGKTDQEIAAAVFDRHTDVLDSEPDIAVPKHDRARDVFQRDSSLVFLRQLARAHEFHAYVLPAEIKGRKSKGFFCALPENASTNHPPLVLLGEGRNLQDAEIQEDSESPERTRSRTLRISDQQVLPFDSTSADVPLMRELPPVPAKDAALRQVPPADQDREDPATRGAAQQLRHSFSCTLTGRVIPGYPAVLTPYLRVAVKAGNTPYSGDWVIRRVIHRITPSVYAQELEAYTNALSPTDNSGAPPTGGSGLSVALSGSLAVF